MGSQAREIKSQTHIYVFINLKGENRPEYLVVPSSVVAKKMYVDEGRGKTGNKFHWFGRNAGKEFVAAQGWKDQRQEGWEIFGSPS